MPRKAGYPHLSHGLGAPSLHSHPGGTPTHTPTPLQEFCDEKFVLIVAWDFYLYNLPLAWQQVIPVR